MFEKILVPLDGSKAAEQVFPPVIYLAKAFNSEIDIVQVCEPEQSEQGHACRLYVNTEMETIQTGLAGSPARVTSVVLDGKPDSRILEYAKESKAGLIIMSSHGRSGIAPWTLGSTVTRVMQRTETPLIIVRPRRTQDTDGRLFQRVIIPLDGSERGARAVPYIIELAKKVTCEVILVQVVEPGVHVHTIGGLNYVRFKERDTESMKDKAKDYLDKAISWFSGSKARVRTEVRTGDAAREIIKLARESDTCLIAIASHGHSALEAWSQGRVSYKVIQGSKRPVMLVPSLS